MGNILERGAFYFKDKTGHGMGHKYTTITLLDTNIIKGLAFILEPNKINLKILFVNEKPLV